jgi:hypothetical protein
VAILTHYNGLELFLTLHLHMLSQQKHLKLAGFVEGPVDDVFGDVWAEGWFSLSLNRSIDEDTISTHHDDFGEDSNVDFSELVTSLSVHEVIAHVRWRIHLGRLGGGQADHGRDGLTSNREEQGPILVILVIILGLGTQTRQIEHAFLFDGSIAGKAVPDLLIIRKVVDEGWMSEFFQIFCHIGLMYPLFRSILLPAGS